jgi:peptide/nickel transport system permease protein
MSCSIPASSSRDRVRLGGRFGERLRRASKRPLLRVGGALVLGFVLMAVFAPWLAPYPADQVSSQAKEDLEHAFESPSWAHPFGRDVNGRDVLSRVVHGSRVSLLVGFVVVLATGLTGVVLGLCAGYRGGWVDEALMRLMDILLAFPGLLLAIAVVALLGAGLDRVILALCLTGWVSYARLTRAQVLVQRELEYVEAERALGASTLRILFRHILPNILSPLTVQATFGMAGAILAEATLSFLGLGVQPPTPSFGSMLLEGTQYMILPAATHLMVFPGAAILLVVLGFNLLGDGLRDVLDPRSIER